MSTPEEVPIPDEACKELRPSIGAAPKGESSSEEPPAVLVKLAGEEDECGEITIVTNRRKNHRRVLVFVPDMLMTLFIFDFAHDGKDGGVAAPNPRLGDDPPEHPWTCERCQCLYQQLRYHPPFVSCDGIHTCSSNKERNESVVTLV